MLKDIETDENTVWVVYRVALGMRLGGQIAHCTQSEWDAKETAGRGQNILLRSGITNEGQAERHVRQVQTTFALAEPKRLTKWKGGHAAGGQLGQAQARRANGTFVGAVV